MCMKAVCTQSLLKSSKDSVTPLDFSSRCLEFASPSHSSTAATVIHRLISKISPKVVK